MLDESIEKYALQMHEDVAETLTIAFNQDGEVDDRSLIKVLATYPAAYSFIVAQHRIIKSEYMIAQRELADEEKKCFASAASECPAKSTVAAISAKAEELYGESLSKLRTRLDDLEQKTKMASDMMNVFDKSINALQSIGKLISNESENYRGKV